MIEPQNLTRKTSLRKLTKDLSFSDLEKIATDLSALLEEREAEEIERREAEAEKEKKVQELRKQMAAAGISEEELVAAIGGGMTTQKGKKAQSKIPPKYEITDDDGKVHQWTGRGRTPKAFQEYFDQGGTREDCLIQ